MDGPREEVYGTDLAYVHDVGFSGFAEGAAPGLLRFCEQAKILEGKVVDLGCGSGVWASRLVEAGYDVYGVDLSPAMIELARRRVPQGVFHVDCCHRHSLPPCRVITALSEVLCYQFGAARGAKGLRAFFSKAYDALEPNGLLIFDVVEVGLDRGRGPTVREAEDWVCLVRYDYNTRTDQLTRSITTFRRRGEHYRRHFESHCLQLYHGHEVANWLRQAGFRVRRLRQFGEHRLLPGRVGFVARKPD